ncbi:autophagy-related protein 9A-like [Oscarella lobularis]|uniref:autophagy-related protein 9A-like n=1 Tax=Oscarella lobularis TaxID=121494 RepID=UPI0033141E3C
MAASYKSKQRYQRILSEDENPPDEHVGTTAQTSFQWGLIKDLDDFFSQIYTYYSRQGFVCIFVEELFRLVQFVFIVFISLVLLVCIDYDFVFHYGDPVVENGTTVRYRFQGNSVFAVFDFKEISRLKTDQMFGVSLFLFVASVFWFVQFVYVSKKIWEAWRMKTFYSQILQIHDDDLVNKTWAQVLQTLIDRQGLMPLCIDKDRLTELDVVNRIMRRRNFLLAMENKGIVSHLYRFPLLGERTFLTLGMKFNLKMILFSDPFATSWQLRDEYRKSVNKFDLADRLSKKFFWIGLVNLLLFPFIFAYQVLYSFFSYVDIIKRNPSTLSSRRWSQYGRIRLRHFNELDHELKFRLDKGYKPGKEYMDCFPLRRLFIVVAQTIGFFAGAWLAILIVANVVNEQLLLADYIFVVISILGFTVSLSRSLIPDENLPFDPQAKLTEVANYVHYIPPSWTKVAHTTQARDYFTRLLQFQIVWYFEELLSPIVTPLLLMFSLRLKAMEIVEFYQKFTVTVPGVGDVCSFAMMDVKKHGNPMWKSDEFTEAQNNEQAENGKTEKSLIAFKAKHPRWRAPQASEDFFSSIQPQGPRVHFASGVSSDPLATLASLPSAPESPNQFPDNTESIALDSLHPRAGSPPRGLYPTVALQQMKDEFGNRVSHVDRSINQAMLSMQRHAEEQEEKVQLSQRKYEEENSVHFCLDTSDESSV